MVEKYVNCNSMDSALKILSEQNSSARIIAGGTDLVLELEKGSADQTMVLVDVSRIPGLDEITLDENGIIHIGAMVTHNQVVGSGILHQYAPLLVEASFGVGSPQIRNRGTIVGNLVTASPANDTISPLIALDAVLTLRSIKGERKVRLADFYTGVRKTTIRPDEMVVEISFKGLDSSYKSLYKKFALRKAQAISLVNLSVILKQENDLIKEVKITLGAVAPTIIHARKAEEYLLGKPLTEPYIEKAVELVKEDISPISDIRSSSDYRKKVSSILLKRALLEMKGNATSTVPNSPVLLWGKGKPNHSAHKEAGNLDKQSLIHTEINGESYSIPFKPGQSLLHLIRDEVHLTGTKEGCGEGECGACTVFMDGVAVMSCLVPAARAEGSQIVTIEGISDNDQLHPVQKAFIDNDAVQCGYCTPGFVMSAVKLFEEKSHPDVDEIKLAITGNLCRCTGYYKIVKAIESVVESE